MERITPLHAPSTTEDLEKSNSDLDFNTHLIEETPPLPRSTENILVRMNIALQYLADVFYLPPGKRNQKTYKPRVTTVGRKLQMKYTKKCIKESKKAKLKNKKKRKTEKELRRRNRR